MFANKITYYVTILMLCSTQAVYSSEAMNADINGITLGMSMSNAIKEMPCNAKPNATINGEDSYNHIHSYQIICETDSDNRLIVNITHDKYVYSVIKYVRYRFVPDWRKIIDKILSKYGSPDVNEKKKMCWGCSGHSTNRKLRVEYGYSDNKGLTIRLEDYGLEKRNEKLNMDAWEDYRKKHSDINL